jgi:RNA polymerase subunit RPABC4/transcription elongation factor Spt4
LQEIFDFFVNFNSGDFDLPNWFNFSLKGIFIYIFILWAALVIWTARDVVVRSKNLAFQVIIILLVIVFNIFGLLIYLIIRPQKTLLERYHESLEQKILTESEESCQKCEKPLPLEFSYCPSCQTEMRKPCKKCKKLVLKKWKICPYCGEKKKKTAHKNLKTKTL